MRASGILMHISSLPSDHGIGTMGREAYRFVDFLAEAKQTYWQIMPIGPTSYGDSPYQSYSTHAGNPYFIDPDMLVEDGLLERSDLEGIDWGDDEERTDYGKLYEGRFPVLRRAYENFRKTGDRQPFYQFLDKNDIWISNYALFMAIKNAHGGKSWLEWDEGLKRRDPHSLWLFKESNADEVEFWEFVQYKFFEQWQALKEYANGKGIQIIGDIPIYVALDSAPVWVHPDLFELDGDLNPKTVAGCPPDAFSPTGQLWGNPIYNWQRHRETGYGWWLDRFRGAAQLYDIVRIDHFRGFDSYYSIPAQDSTAEHGQWHNGPGIEFFRFVESHLGRLPIIAEDLGFLTPSVIAMLSETGFPGMKVLEFAFDPREESNYLPYTYDKNCVVYIGTHDNATIKGWLDEIDRDTYEFCSKFINYDGTGASEFIWSFIRCAFASVGDTLIVQMQDYLELGSDSRMNTPGAPSGNWQWRMKRGAYTPELAARIADITRTYGRCPR